MKLSCAYNYYNLANNITKYNLYVHHITQTLARNFETASSTKIYCVGQQASNYPLLTDSVLQQNSRDVEQKTQFVRRRNSVQNPQHKPEQLPKVHIIFY